MQEQRFDAVAFFREIGKKFVQDSMIIARKLTRKNNLKTQRKYLTKSNGGGVEYV